MTSKNVAVIGAGAMGLAAAYHLLKRGHRVTVFESGSVPGGMAAHFDFDGLSIERFYHFVSTSDHGLFELLDDLALSDAMRWRKTRMGFYYEGELHPWGDPLALLRFPGLSPLSKLRYGLHAFLCTKRKDWSKLDRQTADAWLRWWIGDQAYRVCWEQLLALKFFEFKDQISAAWIWARIKRVGTSRESWREEKLGYIEGGSETLIERLVERIETMGGSVHLSTPIQEIAVQDGSVTGVVTDQGHRAFDEVISTVAIPYAVGMMAQLSEDLVERYQALPNIGVVCVVHKLKRRVSDYFWVNINDERMEIPGIVEFSNLRPTGEDHIVYIPYYMPQSHPKFAWPDERFEAETKEYLQLLNPELEESDFIGCKVGRLRYAQPVCGPGFLQQLPPISTGIAGLQIADTAYYYPEDRGISESVRLGKQMAESVGY